MKKFIMYFIIGFGVFVSNVALAASDQCMFDKNVSFIVKQVEDTAGLKVPCSTKFVFYDDWIKCPNSGKCDTYTTGTLDNLVIHIYRRNFLDGSELSEKDGLNCTILAGSLIDILSNKTNNYKTVLMAKVYRKLGCR